MTTAPGQPGPEPTGRHVSPVGPDGSAQGPPPGGTGAADRSASTGRPEDTPVGELLGNLTSDFSTLVRQEVELAKAEITQSVNKAGKGAGLFGGAGVAGHFVLLFLSIALWWALGVLLSADDSVWPALGWSALIVAVIWAIVAGVLALTGRKEIKDVQGIPQTTETAKKIPDAMKGQEHR